MFKLAFVNLALFLNLLHADVIQFGAANIENLPPRSVIGPSDFNAKTLKEYQGKPLSQFRTPILPINVPIKLLGPNRIDSGRRDFTGFSIFIIDLKFLYSHNQRFCNNSKPMEI